MMVSGDWYLLYESGSNCVNLEGSMQTLTDMRTWLVWHQHRWANEVNTPSTIVGHDYRAIDVSFWLASTCVDMIDDVH